MIDRHFIRAETLWEIASPMKSYTLDDIDCFEARGLALAELDDHPEITDIVLLMEHEDGYNYTLLSCEEAEQLIDLLAKRIAFHQRGKET